MDSIVQQTENLTLSQPEQVISEPVVRGPTFLNKLNDNKAEFDVTLSKINKISSDTYIYTFALPDPELPLGLGTCHHVYIHATLPTKEHPEGERIKRAYTPTSHPNQKGTVDLLIKIYRAGAHPSFPDGGLLTQYLETLKIGDKIAMTGPIFKKSYLGHGKFNVKGVDHPCKEIALVAGGTGITAMYQLMMAIMDDPTDQTKLHLIYASRSEEDMFLKEELEQAAKDPRINIYYTIDKGTPTWKGFTGHINKEMFEKTMPTNDKSLFLWACGPRPMQQLARKLFTDMGYNLDHAYM